MSVPPQAKGKFRGSLSVSGNGKTIEVTLKGKGRGPFPTISGITIDPQPVVTSATLSANASDPSGGALTYSWTVGGIPVAGSGASTVWSSPGIPGSYLVGLTVTNSQGGSATATAPMTISSLSPWPRFRRSIQATGLSSVDTSADTGTVKWVATPAPSPSPTGFFSSPALGPDGTVYAGGVLGDFHAINPDGSQKWTITIGGNINQNNQSSPAIAADGTIYMGTGTVACCGGSDSGTFYALNSDGSLKWSFPTSRNIESSPAIGADGTIYFASDDCTFYALNPNGSQKWSFTPSSTCSRFNAPVSSAVVGTDGTIYFASTAANNAASSAPILYALNPDGTLKRQIDLKSGIVGALPSGSPAIGPDGTVYVAAGVPGSGIILAINPYGSRTWVANVDVVTLGHRQ